MPIFYLYLMFSSQLELTSQTAPLIPLTSIPTLLQHPLTQWKRCPFTHCPDWIIWNHLWPLYTSHLSYPITSPVKSTLWMSRISPSLPLTLWVKPLPTLAYVGIIVPLNVKSICHAPARVLLVKMQATWCHSLGSKSSSDIPSHSEWNLKSLSSYITPCSHPHPIFCFSHLPPTPPLSHLHPTTLFLLFN